MLGDQVYADDASPQTAEFIESRRDTSIPPGREIADFEEYTRLYRESWSPPVMRWLFSTVSSWMIFDDHDMNDDWNISSAWVEEMREQPWWEERVLGGLMSYWIYQHLGNSRPPNCPRTRRSRRLQAADDGTEILREYAAGADREKRGSRWSFYRDVGRTRLIMIDSRAGRMLERGARAMVDEAEWDWIVERATGDFDHLLIGTSLPYVLGEGMQHLETWNELLCEGAWGGLGAARRENRYAGRLTATTGSAFRACSFEVMARLLEELSSGNRGIPRHRLCCSQD